MNEKAKLKQNPDESWIKKMSDKDTNEEYEFLPISKVEELLSEIFKYWWVDLKPPVIHPNSVTVLVTLNVELYNGEIWHQDGGAMVSSSRATPQTVFQMAESFAIKDAAEKFGNIFGRNLNRDKVILTPLDKIKELVSKKRERLSPEEEIEVDRIIKDNDTKKFNQTTIFLNSIK